MKILNLYAGLGGNREEWPDEHMVTAVELDEKIAAEYQEKFPDDEVVVADAHGFLLEHSDDFDFIWSSPPCMTHSVLTAFQKKKQYIDMTLYQEILFLRFHFTGKWCVENVYPFYRPLMHGEKRGRHLLWTNFWLPQFDVVAEKVLTKTRKEERNKVEPVIGKRVLEAAIHELEVAKQFAKMQHSEQLDFVNSV